MRNPAIQPQSIDPVIKAADFLSVEVQLRSPKKHNPVMLRIFLISSFDIIHDLDTLNLKRLAKECTAAITEEFGL